MRASKASAVHCWSRRAKKAAEIDKAEKNALLADDPQFFKSLQDRVKVMREELAEIDQQLAAEPEKINGYTREELQALNDWWNDFEKRAVTVPIKAKKLPFHATFYQDPSREDQALMVNASVYNDELTKLGCEVRLWWSTRTVIIKKGKPEGQTPEPLHARQGRTAGQGP